MITNLYSSCLTTKIESSHYFPVLISWEHKRLSKIVKHLLPSLPAKKYPKDRFDLVWILDLDTGEFREETQDCRDFGIAPGPTADNGTDVEADEPDALSFKQYIHFNYFGCFILAFLSCTTSTQTQRT